MTRTLALDEVRPHGRSFYGGEPMVFHCNFFNYWLQKTMLLDPTLGMERVIEAAATEATFAMLQRAAASTPGHTLAHRTALAEHSFAQLGFGTMDLSKLTEGGGIVDVPVSHYGQCLRQAVSADFAAPQTLFDAGYASAAAAFLHGLPSDTFRPRIEACASMGAPAGRIAIELGAPEVTFPGYAHAAHGPSQPAPPNPNTSVDEPGILQALAGLDFSGNEEGLIPRFGVMLTRHFASFYNRSSFEFLARMNKIDLGQAAEMLLVDTGYRCAFHTFGGIMTSPEWDAVIRPQCKTRTDWVHGMVAVINTLGWGTWRVHEVDENHVVMHISDDYESCGWRDMYGTSARPVSFLAAAGVAGLMNLIFAADIHDKPVLDLAFYEKAFESNGLFVAESRRSMAMGHEITEIIASR